MTTEAENNGRLVYSVKEAAHFLGLSENSLRTALANPNEAISRVSIRVGHRILLSKAGIARLLEAGASSEPTAQERGEGE